MRLDDLKKYTGSRVKPEEYDKVWDQWIQTAKSHPLNYHIEEQSIPYQGVKYEQLFFEGIGGGEVCSHIFRKENSKNAPVLFMFHGYSANSGDVFDKLPYVYNGFTVVAMDTRGQGGLSQDHTLTNGTTWQGHIIRGLEEGRENLLYKKIFLDTIVLKRIIQNLPCCSNHEMAAMGFSQGGALSVVCAALNEEVTLSFIGYPFLSDYYKACELSKNGAYSAFDELQCFFKVRDPLHEKEEEFFGTLDYIDVQFMAERIRGKALCFTGMLDALVPLETQFAIFNKIQCEKKLYVYPEYGHEELPKAKDIILQTLIETFKK